jgi:hypothetical protein
MKVTIDVANLTGIQAIVSSPIDITVLIAVIIGIVYAVIHMRKKR